MPNSLDLVYVEDDPTDAQFFERALRKWNPACKFCRYIDGKQAADYIESLAVSNDALPKLLVLDIKLPKLLGFDVLQITRDRSRTRCLPVIMLFELDSAARYQPRLRTRCQRLPQQATYHARAYCHRGHDNEFLGRGQSKSRR